MALSSLDGDVVADCCTDSSETDLELPPTGLGTHSMIGVVPRQPKLNPAPESFGVVPRDAGSKSQRMNGTNHSYSAFMPKVTHPFATTSGHAGPYIRATQNICDDMIEDGAHVVFDWDNTLKLYDKQTHQLSCRVSREFLLHLKHNRKCCLYIISAIRPSALNLGTLLSEVERLGLTDVFVNPCCDDVDGGEGDKAVVKAGEYAHMGNVIICGYDKAETFLKLSAFNSARGDRVVFFDDEEVNIHNFSALVPNSICYLCE